MKLGSFYMEYIIMKFLTSPIVWSCNTFYNQIILHHLYRNERKAQKSWKRRKVFQIPTAI